MSENKQSMGHFIDWKFGVPVKVFGRKSGQRVEGLLVYEDGEVFKTLRQSDNNWQSFYKEDYYYELIPYNARLQSWNRSPRYPICQTPGMEAIYCNKGNKMSSLHTVDSEMIRMPDHTATLTIDGKEIELSQETIENLIKELGA